MILVEKIRKVKYLQEQFELRSRSNLSEVLDKEHSLLLEVTVPSSFKLSLPYLSTDEARPVILKVLHNLQYREIIRSHEAGAFSEEDMESPAMYQEVIDLEETLGDYIQAQAQAHWNDPSAPEEDLFHYLMHYTLPARWTSRNAPPCSARWCHSTKTVSASATSSACTTSTSMPRFTRRTRNPHSSLYI